MRTDLSALSYWLRRPFVWLSRITHCQGFGIQSPTDYWLVRHVICQQWPYYQYPQLNRLGKGPLQRKLGCLYFRLANWRQPSIVIDPSALPYWTAGCQRAQVCPQADRIELMRLEVSAHQHPDLDIIYNKVDAQSVLVVEGIWRNRQLWRQIEADERTGITFDLYYCGIVLFDKTRYKQNYIINF